MSFWNYLKGFCFSSQGTYSCAGHTFDWKWQSFVRREPRAADDCLYSVHRALATHRKLFWLGLLSMPSRYQKQRLFRCQSPYPRTFALESKARTNRMRCLFFLRCSWPIRAFYCSSSFQMLGSNLGRVDSQVHCAWARSRDCVPWTIWLPFSAM